MLTYSSGNSSAGVTADPSWQPLLTTVPEPDYPSGHGVLSGVAEAVLRKYDTCIQYDTYILTLQIHRGDFTLCRKRSVHLCAVLSRQDLCHCDVECWHGLCLAGSKLHIVLLDAVITHRSLAHVVHLGGCAPLTNLLPTRCEQMLTPRSTMTTLTCMLNSP